MRAIVGAPLIYLAVWTCSRSHGIALVTAILIPVLGQLSERKIHLGVIIASVTLGFYGFVPSRPVASIGSFSAGMQAALGLGGVVAGFGLIYGAFRLLVGLRKASSSGLILLGAVLIGMASKWVSLSLPDSAYFHVLIVAFQLLFFQIWSVTYCALESRPSTPSASVTLAGIAKTFTFFPLPYAFFRGIRSYVDSRQGPRPDSWRLFRSGVQLLVQGTLYYSLSRGLLFDWEGMFCRWTGIPRQLDGTFFDSVMLGLRDRRLPIHQLWTFQILEFLKACFLLFGEGHIAVGLARMAGFSFERNTNAPFLATSIRDFFNRYNFYFKELILNVFYYPSFFALSGRSPRVRIALATFLSVGLGTFIFHQWFDANRSLYLGHPLELNPSLAIYSFGLMAGVLSSVMMELNPRDHAFNRFLRRTAPVRVTAYYLLLNIFWSPTVLGVTVEERITFGLSLFGR